MPTETRWPLFVSALLTATVVALLATFFLVAGGLWRDEANSAAFAENLHDVHWIDLQRDSFPAAWPLLLRAWIDVAGTSDRAYRTFGLLAGVCVVLGIWWTAISDRRGPPMVALMLLAGQGAAIRTISSVRAYGVAAVAMLLLIGTLRRLVDESTVARHAAVLVWSLCAVHLLYLNCALVFAAICSAVITVALERRFRDALVLLAAGVASALTMLIYLPVIRAARPWIYELQTDRYGLSSYWNHLRETISFHSPGLTALWGLVIALALVCGVLANRRGVDVKQRQSLVFGAALLCISVAAYGVLLHLLRLATSWWYYVPLLVVIAGATDMLYGATLCAHRPRLVAACCLTVSIVVLPLAANVASMRQTNVDLVAGEVARTATAQDFVVVQPWVVGVSYARYHRASAPWQTLPPMSTHRWHQWNEAAAKENDTHATDPLFRSVTARMKAGGRIYVVSDRPQETAMSGLLEANGMRIVRQYTTTHVLPERLILQVWGSR